MKLSQEEKENLLQVLEHRFNQNMNRHKGLTWKNIVDKLKEHPSSLWSLNEMEKTGGEPDVVDLEPESGVYIFCDCSQESPNGRRSACYDREAQDSRKKHKPEHNAMEMATAMGINILTEKEYRQLQELGKFDTKTSSWIQTPGEIRKLGGALFADFRYNHVFIYHNGADSYYAARGFRGSLRV